LGEGKKKGEGEKRPISHHRTNHHLDDKTRHLWELDFAWFNGQ